MEIKNGKGNSRLMQKFRDFMCAEGTYGEAPLSAREVMREQKEEIEKIRNSVGYTETSKNGNEKRTKP